MNRTFGRAFFAAEDRDQFEGPIGESIMPAASIGYSRVVSKNIHSGKTGTGYAVNEFYTAQDFPFDLKGANSHLKTDKTTLNGPGDVRYSIYTGILNYSASYLRRSQGVRFVLNSMHGKPRRSAAYSGDFQTGKQPAIAVQETLYDYYQPGEKIPVLIGQSIQDTVHAYPGKEMDVLAETRKVVDVTDDVNVYFDFTLALATFIPLPFVSTVPEVTINDHNFYTYTTTKVVKYPAVLKRTTVKKEGASNDVEYVAYHKQSGKPAIVKTADGYDKVEHGAVPEIHDGSYYSISIPAYSVYDMMGQKAVTERKIIYSESIYTTQVPWKGFGVHIDKRYELMPNGDEQHYLSARFTQPKAEERLFDYVRSGDLVRIFTTDALGTTTAELGVYHIGHIAGNRIELVPTSLSWRTTDFLQSDVHIEIIRSGRMNYLNTNAAEYTTYGQPPVIQEFPAH